MVEPITEFLSTRVELDADRFSRSLPAHLIVQTCRQAYIHWAGSGDFEALESALRAGMAFVLRGATPPR
ncbi:hypothetical protein C6A88_11235 [Mycolicibacterium austroafricanum]|nr:hypothetical protein C6A88_11235 [Mycolicibacterium austroafricanum]